MLVLSQEFYDHNASLQNDLVGPFHNPSKIKGIQYCGPQERWHAVGRPTVRSMSTFEEYLERTVNSMRSDSQIAFHPSQASQVRFFLAPVVAACEQPNCDFCLVCLRVTTLLV